MYICKDIVLLQVNKKQNKILLEKIVGVRSK